MNNARECGGFVPDVVLLTLSCNRSINKIKQTSLNNNRELKFPHTDEDCTS